MAPPRVGRRYWRGEGRWAAGARPHTVPATEGGATALVDEYVDPYGAIGGEGSG
ncbi:hypothetical protein ACFV1C_01065 [Streptomyces sp. NPDC059605]|uniref:hypothetical protein n=1 Tax=unclassified Streptomyces TaxID=2593676 RepID=UPI0036C7814D